MLAPEEGYVFHSYGAPKYVQHVVASITTLRRYDHHRPIALYCSEEHQALLEQHGLDTLFAHIEVLPKAHRSIVGFKHHLHLYKPFDRSLYVDADMVWCRDPNPLWTRLSPYAFTATGQDSADFFFGGPKGFGVLLDALFDRRRRTMKRFGLSYLPRVQAGMIYIQDVEMAERVSEAASYFLNRRHETHFRSRLTEGRSEESCEWSMAMAMSALDLPIFPWMQAQNSPQLDYVEGFVEHDETFRRVRCRYYLDALVYSARGLRSLRNRLLATRLLARWPGRGDYMVVTPFVLHFGWLHQKGPFFAFSDAVWSQLTSQTASPQRVPRSLEPVA